MTLNQYILTLIANAFVAALILTLIWKTRVQSERLNELNDYVNQVVDGHNLLVSNLDDDYNIDQMHDQVNHLWDNLTMATIDKMQEDLATELGLAFDDLFGNKPAEVVLTKPVSDPSRLHMVSDTGYAKKQRAHLSPQLERTLAAMGGDHTMGFTD